MFMAKPQKSKFELAVIERVTAMRRQKGLTQEYLAEVLGLSKGFIGQIESPRSPSKYSLDQLNKLAEEMNCSPQEFIPERFIIE